MGRTTSRKALVAALRAEGGDVRHDPVFGLGARYVVPVGAASNGATVWIGFATIVASYAFRRVRG